jgi:hypothetical protein
MGIGSMPYLNPPAIAFCSKSSEAGQRHGVEQLRLMPFWVSSSDELRRMKERL